MIANKKAIVLEALGRIVIVAIIIYFFFDWGAKAANLVWGDDAKDSFENLANKLNADDFKVNEGKPAFILLNDKTAVIGFSKNSKEFRCHNCGVGTVETYLSVKKPSNEECDNKPCMCLCSSGLDSEPESDVGTNIKCKEFSCETLMNDITPKIELKDTLNKIYKRELGYEYPPPYPYWENGFFFVRDTSLKILSGIPKGKDRRITIAIEKENLGSVDYVAVCPELPCFT
ncbi:hypothetical protein HYS31_00495 [Candidatus Woesearchaeota archaeon]|nr:hypothetical protein [Candidatus Woesearchaeota archaeon]